MTAPLKWRSQLCPCGYCPDGTRIEWRYRIDIRFRPRRHVSGDSPEEGRTGVRHSERRRHESDGAEVKM